MNNSLGMKVIEGMNQLLSDLPAFFFWEVPIILQDLKHVSLSKLSDHTELMLCLKRVEQENDILVIQLFQNFNFLSQVDELSLCLSSEH